MMTVDEDVEKTAGLESLAEKSKTGEDLPAQRRSHWQVADTEAGIITGDEDGRANLRSRARSRRHSRSRSRSRAESFQGDDQMHNHATDSRSRSRSPAPSNPPQDRVPYAPDARLQYLKTCSSGNSRAPSHDGGVKPTLAAAVQMHQSPPRPMKALDPDHPGEFVIDHHLDNLVQWLDKYTPGRVQSRFDALKAKLSWRKEPGGPPPPGELRFRISFAEVQRLRIRKLQCELVRHVVKMRLNGQESTGWEEALKEYIKALQDHDYMEKRSKSIRDPFLATGEYNIDRYVLDSNINSALAGAIAMDPSTCHVASLKPWERPSSEHQESICGTRNANIARTSFLGFKNRVLLAAVGGAFLIGPMWLMVLRSALYTTLITTTVFVAGFGVLMAYCLEEDKDVLGSTAAYAAVLVVFVGTSTQGTGLST